MKEWYTARELAGIGLSCLPETQQGVLYRAKNEGWESQKRIGQGGGYEYHISNLPADARKALEAQQIEALIPQISTNKQLQIKKCDMGALTLKQRQVTDARATVLKAIKALRQQGVTKEAAMTTLLTQAETGALVDTSPVLDKALRMAKDARGRKGSDYPSVRTLKRWLSPNNKTLTPKRTPSNFFIPAWVSAFMDCYQQPEKPTVTGAYRQFEKQWSGELPSIHAVRRFLDKVGNVSLQHGRMGNREIKNLKAFVRRDFSQLLPGDVYSADGHTFDAEVAHPYHGRPFRPEITTFIDIATRRAVGYSIDLAESGIAVLDALIDACTKALPAMLYVDNGSGYCNALLKDEALGVLARLGTEVRHSLPYNSQARGVIERVHQTLWIEGAKQIPGYIGHDMDREAAQMQHKISRKAIKEGGKTHLLGWEAFIEFCEDRMDEYNNRPHTSLPKITDDLGRRRHLTPNEQWELFEKKGWQADTLNADEAADIFRPRVTRKVRRCEIRLNTNIYFSHALEEHHGDEVQIAFDFKDAQFIWVYELESGRLICKAEWNANKAHYMPMSYILQAREKRADARLKRIDIKRDEIEAERRGGYAIEQEQHATVELTSTRKLREKLQQQSYVEAEFEEVKAEPEKAMDIEPESTIRLPEHMTFEERFETYKRYASGEVEIPVEHEFWFKTFPKSKAYQSAIAREQQDLTKWG